MKFVSPDGSLALNPAWKSGPGTARKVENGYGTFDPIVASMLSTNPGLICDWAPAAGPSDLFLTTQVRHIDEATKEAALARIGKLGWTCTHLGLSDDWCVDNTNNGGVLVGESQYFRDGIWLASNWNNAGPQTYTPELVKTLFG